MKIFIFSLSSISFAQIRTSSNTCTNEKSIFKLDVRQRVLVLPPKSTVRDIDASLCQEAYMYDYIWINQMWTPGGYNYQVNSYGEAQQANNYRDLQSIKECSIDPELGQLTDLLYFQQKIKNFCPHMKFLGEFSFYISEDSYLLHNIVEMSQQYSHLILIMYQNKYSLIHLQLQ